MKKNLLITMLFVLVLGVSMTVFALSSQNESDNYNNDPEATELEIEACPLEPLEDSETDSEATAC